MSQQTVISYSPYPLYNPFQFNVISNSYVQSFFHLIFQTIFRRESGDNYIFQRIWVQILCWIEMD